MRKKSALCRAVLLLAIAVSSSAQAWDAGLAASLDKLSANAWQPSLLTAFGTFTYADTGLPSPFSRYLEDALKSSFAASSRLRLFNRSVAAAMDPAFRAIYGDFFKDNSVDALLSGRYYVEGQSVRARLELTGLSDGVLLGASDLRVPRSALPPDLAVEPSAAATATAASIGHLVPASEAEGLRVTLSTDRGAGAVYREGERLMILVTVNKAAWIKVYNIDAAGQVTLIYPNAYAKGKILQPGSLVRIPDGSFPYTWDIIPPFGAEFIKVVASTRPFETIEATGQGEAFASLGGDAKSAMTRGIRVAAAPSAVPAELAEAMASYVSVRK